MRSPTSRRWVLILVAALVGCGESHDTPDADVTDDFGIEPSDGSPPDRDIGPEDASFADAYDAFVPIRCGFETCADGEECCFATGMCFSTSGGCGSGTPESCLSNADCESVEYCRSDTCLGPGWCARRPEGCGRSTVCGCDGRDYESLCQAAELGVRVSHTGTLAGCGLPAPPAERMDCTTDAQCPDDGTCADAGYCVYGTPLVACSDDTTCPSGMSCCESSGTCVRDDCAGCCAELPEGTLAPCENDDDCRGFDATAFCFREACSGPGGCAFPPASCGGEAVPVCGCDDVTYTNVCWAQQERLAIAGPGECE